METERKTLINRLFSFFFFITQNLVLLLLIYIVKKNSKYRFISFNFLLISFIEFFQKQLNFLRNRGKREKQKKIFLFGKLKKKNLERNIETYGLRFFIHQFVCINIIQYLHERKERKKYGEESERGDLKYAHIRWCFFFT